VLWNSHPTVADVEFRKELDSLAGADPGGQHESIAMSSVLASSGTVSEALIGQPPTRS
jgi:hypothetical protein